MFGQFRPAWRTLVVGGLFSATVCGCGGKPWESVNVAKGVITHKGKPVKDAEIKLFPVDSEFPESVRPWAKSNENGEFALSTYDRDDGAPTGAYKVTVVHHEIVVKGESMMAKPNDLPKKYATKDTTDLTIEIGPGNTTIPPLDLK
ncbi:MAG TPA: hypothetical protein VFG20_09400 [Planctomycetaceae bacterium]|nr:hypothetical protein [Planctomycetaceae bacterium]